MPNTKAQDGAQNTVMDGIVFVSLDSDVSVLWADVKYPNSMFS